MIVDGWKDAEQASRDVQAMLNSLTSEVTGLLRFDADVSEEQVGSEISGFGVEIVPEAIEDAKANAQRNGVTNMKFFAAAAEDVAERGYFDEENPLVRPDVIVLDPPRKGCEPSLLRVIRELAPDRIVYVSCDSATLARDLALLTQGGYRIRKVQPVDQFCHSVHVETVCLLTHKD